MWGANNFGQLGNGDLDKIFYILNPVKVKSLNK